MNSQTTKSINWKKIFLFLIITFSFSWLVALVLYILKIDFNSILSTISIAFFYMFGPALGAVVVQKFIYKDKLSSIGFNFDKTKIKEYVKIPILFLLLLFFCFTTIFILGNLFEISVFGKLDFSQENFNENLLSLIKSKSDLSIPKIPDMPVVLMFIVFIVQGIIAGFTINIPIMFGEEFGWRGILLNETKSMGFIKSSTFIGIFWGLWHLPLIMMGLNYPNYPYLGIVMMCLFTISLSPLFSYLRIKLNSILGPCILHGCINATGTIFILYIKDGNELFSSIAGFAGIISAFITSVLFLYFIDKAFFKTFQGFR